MSHPASKQCKLMTMINRQINLSKKAYIPPIIVDDPVNGKQLLEDLNHLTNEVVTGRVIGNKLKIFLHLLKPTVLSAVKFLMKGNSSPIRTFFLKRKN
ncbi:hypothetical protein CDAR_371721 [Caerostris darwini]|uniref:Uncharacterized protein n=1 Tax=Caerostris darwini TaxID=1538125 RepID=A0AAV4T9L0_9ARAC|nr:hypothetical protein CDAR_371721 [Caerostris darwini]